MNKSTDNNLKQKKYHKNKKLNEALNLLSTLAKNDKKGFSKEQKKQFIDNIIQEYHKWHYIDYLIKN